MCGIAGILDLRGGALPPFDPAKILDTLRHRGPDDEGTFLDTGVFLGARRLSIIDPEHGHQPVSDEAGRFHLVMNGEIYDYDVLLADLVQRGHAFRSHCDTEVAVHLFEEKGSAALDAIDGQFALAVYDRAERRLLLARDRMGISPLFWARVGDLLVFASEMKAIFATGLIEPRIDPRALDAVLALGCVPPPRALFQGIRSLPPGHLLDVRDGRIEERTYWDIPYPDAGEYPRKRESRWAEEFHDILRLAARRRLKADVPVGVYLSGGIDSATIAALLRDTEGIRGRVFSIGFREKDLDETPRTRKIARYLGLDTHFLTYSPADLARDLPKLVHHAETPLLLTESVALMALSGLAAKHVKVVLTGEGSDEAFGGYDYFRWETFKVRCEGSRLRRPLEAVTRRFVERAAGPRNPFFPAPEDRAWADEVFGCYPAMMLLFYYWRAIREQVYSPEMIARQQGLPDSDLVDLPRERIRRWDPLNRSLYVSSRVFMVGHLLGAHGDRALMTHSVEGRYPFLDRTVQEFLATAPPPIKTRPGMEKYLLRLAMKGRLPRDVLRRRKKPFQAPIGTPFIGPDAPDYARELLGPRALEEYGYFDAGKVRAIVERVERGGTPRRGAETLRRFIDGCALTFVLSTQLIEAGVRGGEFSTPRG
jgi:asparagine synthase (glutamine-hydrolysing)